MNKRELGKTSMQVSEIAFGGVEIGMPYGIGIKGADDMLTEQDAIRLLEAALNSGINFFDTARMYGNSENLIGKAFEKKRAEVIISTKCRHFRDSEGKLPPDDVLKKFINDSLQESLQALRTNYVDIFMLHQADTEILHNETIAKEFSLLKEKGIVRATGASVYLSDETELAIRSGIWDIVQLPFNIMDQRQSSLFDLAAQHEVGIVVRSVLLKGLLSDRGKDLHPAIKEVENHIGKYGRMLNENIPDLPTLAIKFALSFKQVSSVLIGMDKMEYLSGSLAIADGNYFEGGFFRELKQMAYPDPGFINLPHWSKMGWL